MKIFLQRKFPDLWYLCLRDYAITHQVSLAEDKLYCRLSRCVGDSGTGLIEDVEGKLFDRLLTDPLVGTIGEGADQREDSILSGCVCVCVCERGERGSEQMSVCIGKHNFQYWIQSYMSNARCLAYAMI